MADIAELYADEIHDHFKVLYANWPVGQPLQIGDYGRVRSDIFIREGNVKQRGVSFNVVPPDNTKDDYEFRSTGGVEVKFNGKAAAAPGGVPIKASIEISFTKKEAVFFIAADVTHHLIDDPTDVGSQIMDLYKKDRWDSDWAVVVQLVEAGATTITTSLSATAALTLEASSDQVEQLTLKDASVGVTAKYEKDVGLKIVAKTGLKPLLALAGIRRKIPVFGSPGWQPWMLRGETVSLEVARTEATKVNRKVEDIFEFGLIR